jgi:hypothetical protein
MWVSYNLEWKAILQEVRIIYSFQAPNNFVFRYCQPFLHLKAPLRLIRWGENSGAEACQLPNSGSIEVLRRGYLVIYIGCGTPVRLGPNTRDLPTDKAYQYNHQARSRNDMWISDFPLDESSFNLHALLIAHGTTQNNVEGGRMDVGLVLEPIGRDKNGKWRRVGLFQQHYWDRDEYPIFASPEKEPLELSHVLIL